MTTQSARRRPTERASARARAGRVRPARPRRSGRASTADRRPRARTALRRARARRVRAQVALHVDRRARTGRLCARSRASRSSARSTLNWAVGGMNALAVEIAAREGARIVWMPTVDSPAETAGRTEPKAGDKVPQWARLQHELRELGLERRARARHRRRRRAPAGDARRAARDRAARADPRDGPPRPRRHVRGRRRRARGGRHRHRRHASGVPVPELLDRGPGRRSPRGAACSSAA